MILNQGKDYSYHQFPEGRKVFVIHVDEEAFRDLLKNSSFTWDEKTETLQAKSFLGNVAVIIAKRPKDAVECQMHFHPEKEIIEGKYYGNTAWRMETKSVRASSIKIPLLKSTLLAAALAPLAWITNRRIKLSKEKDHE